MTQTYRKSFGKCIEKNIIKSLRLAGASVQESAELDHNNKIDCTINLNGQLLGIQISLRGDPVKVRAAKICALDLVPRFIYLRMGGEYFHRPDRREGDILFSFLAHITKKYPHNALFVNLANRKVNIVTL